MLEDANASPALFPPTRWSLVMRASADDTLTTGALGALGELLKNYWQPLYVFARRSGLDQQDAEDAVQSFCQSLIQRESLRSADAAMGKLRSFLLGAFQNHLRTLHRDAKRQKRGGGLQFVAFNDAEAGLNIEPADGQTPDRAFDRKWAYTLLDRVLERLRAEYAERGRGDVFAVLEPALVWNGAAMSHEAMGAQLGVSVATVAQTIKRMRARYRVLLDEELADTVDGPEALAEERLYLIRVLSGQ